MKWLFAKNNIELTGRQKSPFSIASKLKNRNVSVDIQEGKLYGLVPDACGFRAVVKNPNEAKEAAELINTINLANNDLSIGSILDKGPKPIFDDESLSNILESDADIIYKKKFDSLPNMLNLLFLDTKRGEVAFELQVVGDKTNKLMEKEHKFYNFKTKGAAFENGKIDEKMNKIFKQMSPEEISAYDDYIAKCYGYTRALELGESVDKPALPKGLNELLKLL